MKAPNNVKKLRLFIILSCIFCVCCTLIIVAYLLSRPYYNRQAFLEDKYEKYQEIYKSLKVNQTTSEELNTKFNKFAKNNDVINYVYNTKEWTDVENGEYCVIGDCSVRANCQTVYFQPLPDSVEYLYPPFDYVGLTVIFGFDNQDKLVYCYKVIQ